MWMKHTKAFWYNARVYYILCIQMTFYACIVPFSHILESCLALTLKTFFLILQNLLMISEGFPWSSIPLLNHQGRIHIHNT